MLEDIQLRTQDGNCTSAVKLAEALQAMVDEYGEDYLRDPQLATVLAECVQVRNKQSTLDVLEHLIEDGVTGWLLDAYDGDTTLVTKVTEYANEHQLGIRVVYSLCNDIEYAIGGDIEFTADESEVEALFKSYSSGKKHIAFRGIELGCTYNQFIKRLTSLEPATTLELAYNGKAVIKSTYNDSRVNIEAYYIPTNNKIYKVSVYSESWLYEDQYKPIIKKLTNRFGNPLHVDACSDDVSMFKLPEGQIILDKIQNYLHITYIDKITLSSYPRY